MSKPDDSWENLVKEFRRVCLLKLEGQITESERLLAKELPKTIVVWSRQDHRDPATKRACLREMFESEQRRMGEAWKVQRMVLDQLSSSVLAELREELRSEVRVSLSQTVEKTPAAESSPLGSPTELPPAHSSEVRPQRQPRVSSTVWKNEIAKTLDIILSEQVELRPPSKSRTVKFAPID